MKRKKTCSLVRGFLKAIKPPALEKLSHDSSVLSSMEFFYSVWLLMGLLLIVLLYFFLFFGDTPDTHDYLIYLIIYIINMYLNVQE